MHHSPPVECRGIIEGNSYLWSLVFDLSYCRSIAMQRLRLVVCLKVILKVQRQKNFLDFLFITGKLTCVCIGEGEGRRKFSVLQG